MSVNVLLNEQGTEPLRSENEYFILRRNDISFSIDFESKNQYQGEGYLILTSNRLVLFPLKQNPSFRAIEIPLNQIYSEEFKQPLFGKSHIKGMYRPLFQNQFGNYSFTIWFKSNRVGTLVGAFFTLIDSFRNNQGRDHNFNIMKCLRENNFNEIFAIDPGDESKLYHNQPSAANIPKQNYQSVIINRPNNLYNGVQRQNNNNNENFYRLNEEEVKQKDDVYMSHFVYKNPNEKFVYKDPGFVYKEPNNINNNSNNNINNNMSNINNRNNNINNNINYNIYNRVNNANNINNNIYYVNNNINNNNIINNRLKLDDDDDLVNPYDVKNKNSNNNINMNNINHNINNRNINMNYQSMPPNIPQNIPPRVIMNPNPIVQSQFINRNIQYINNNNNKDDMDFNNPYQIKNPNIPANNIIYQSNPQFNHGYPLQNNINIPQQNYIPNVNNQNIPNMQIPQMNNKYNQIHGPLNENDNKIVQPNNNKIIDNNKNMGKYKPLSEEIPDENELNSKNQLNNNEFNENSINFDNKQDLSLISHKEDSLPDLSNIYPDI